MARIDPSPIFTLQYVHLRRSVLMCAVNRCQLEVQRSVGAPAQAEKVDDIRTDLANVVTRLTALENKMDMLQMVNSVLVCAYGGTSPSLKLNQTQLQALQTVQDQQGKLIAAISPVLPLLQGIAPHLENLRRDVSDGFRDLKSTHGTSERRNAATAVVDAPSAQSLRDTPPSRSTPEHPSDSARRKKRKLDAENNTRGTPNGVSLRNGTNHKHPDSVAKTLMTTASSPPPLHSMLAASSASPEVPLRLGYAHQMRTPYRTPRRPPLVDLLNPNATSGLSRSTLLFTAQGGVSTQSGNAELLSASVHAPRTPGGTLRSDGNTATLTVPKPPTLVPGTPKNADSLASTTSTLSQSSIVRHDSVRAVAGGPSMSSEQLKTVAIKSPSSATVPSLALVTPARQGNFTPSGSAHLLRTVALNGSGTPVVNRPLSLKDIRALTATPAFVRIMCPGYVARLRLLILLLAPSQRQEGKRFIPLDDDDDDDLVE